MFSWLDRSAPALRQAQEEITGLKQELQRREAQLAHLKAFRVPVPTPRRMRDVLKGDGAAYQSAQPFPHVVLDEFLDDNLLREVLKEFEAMDRGGWHHTDKVHERKWSTENVAELGPRTRYVFAELNGGPFLAFLEKLTGIDGLIADPHLRGGGLHEIRRGGKLGVHADFNFYERLGVYRRLNLLIYLNQEWQEEWGGHLELWDHTNTHCVARIAPIFNRAVLFDTSNFSYHGHPHPLACPNDRSRKSLALYYYSVTYPYEEDLAPHGTIFAKVQE
jgi:hypothetical protein